MSRTYRRRGDRYEYRWVLREHEWVNGTRVPFRLDPRSKEGRKALAYFHSDAQVTMRSGAPRWYRRVHDKRLDTLNARELRRWMDDSGYDPVFHPRHRHWADWSWW